MFDISRPGADTGGLLGRVIQEQTHLLSAEARGTTRGGTRAETGCRTVGAAMSRGLIAGTSQTHRNTRADVVAESDGANELCAADCVLFAGRKSSGDRRYAGMRTRRPMRVVRFVRVRKHAITERRFDGAADDVRSDHCRYFPAPITACEL